uniref:Uncharacterized protein n=1 Tax=uncultured prokaryote TaxID=198431 RepID=A0A0H5Q7T6_9ZZZZ|nr:hypothetical protein [uncultured prokaryote]
MTTVREISMNWLSSRGVECTTVMHFGVTGFGISVQRNQIKSAFQALNGSLATGTSYTVATEGREFNAETGVLTGMWNEATARTSGGSDTSGELPEAAQLLIRMNTGVVNRGRFVKGRIFVPSLGYSANLAGETSQAARDNVDDFLGELISTDTEYSIWSRPTPGGEGALALVQDGSCWEEFSYQGRRRM